MPVPESAAKRKCQCSGTCTSVAYFCASATPSPKLCLRLNFLFQRAQPADVNTKWKQMAAVVILVLCCTPLRGSTQNFDYDKCVCVCVRHTTKTKKATAHLKECTPSSCPAKKPRVTQKLCTIWKHGVAIVRFSFAKQIIDTPK